MKKKETHSGENSTPLFRVRHGPRQRNEVGKHRARVGQRSAEVVADTRQPCSDVDVARFGEVGDGDVLYFRSEPLHRTHGLKSKG